MSLITREVNQYIMSYLILYYLLVDMYALLFDWYIYEIWLLVMMSGCILGV